MSYNHFSRTVLCFGAVALLATSAPMMGQGFFGGNQAPPPDVNFRLANEFPEQSCAELANYTARNLSEIQVTYSTFGDTASLHCRVTGVLAPEIAFEVALPLNWNGRFYMIGNGGHAGDALDGAGRVNERNNALRQGFAFAQTNTGHYSAEEGGASFVMSNPQKALDYAYRAVHLTAVTAKELVAEYYGMAPMHSYWNSCSNGGRQGLMEVQRYPTDFDGVLANAPWSDQTGFTIGALWNQRALDEAPLTQAKVNLLADAVMEKCDAVDGLEDGLISAPRACEFNAATDVAACSAGQDNDNCLTPAQAETVMKIYSGPMTSDGEQIFHGFELGSERNWMGLVVPNMPGGRSADFNLAENTMRYLVFVPPMPDYDYKDFNFDEDVDLLENWSRKADADNPDIWAFRANGGKLLMTYGWADPILQPMMGVEYYERVEEFNGNGETNDVMDFARLFMVPGMSHCGGGIGTSSFDSLQAIVNWVEQDRAPDSLLGSRIVDGQVVRTRPICPYPQMAEYSGEGSIDDAANFSCVEPPVEEPEEEAEN